MRYDYECPKCGRVEEVEIKLAELKTHEVFCRGEKKKHRKYKMKVIITYAVPVSASWSDW